MKSKCLLLFFLFFTLSTLSAKEMVFSTLKGMYIAKICSQVLIEAYQKLDVKLEIIDYPAKRAILMSNSGDIDGEVMRVEGAENDYPNLIRVKPQICAMESRVYVKNKKFQFEGWHSMKSFIIGIHRGHLYAAKGTRGMNAVEIDTDDQLMRMLNKGRLDLVVSQVPDALRSIIKFNLTEIHSLDPSISYFPLYHYLHKKHVDLIPEIEMILKGMDNEGRMDVINHELLSKLNRKLKKISGKLDVTSFRKKGLWKHR